MNKEREITQRMREIARQCRAILSMGKQRIGKRLEKPLTRTEEERFDRLHARWLELKAERDRLQPRTKRPPSTPRPPAMVVRSNLMRQAIRDDAEQAMQSAHHEAAHAVAAVVDGIGVRRIELLWRLERGRLKNVGGECYFTKGSQRVSPVVFLAAKQAVLRCRRWAADVSGCEADDDQAEQAARRDGRSLAQETERARQLLDRNWGGVCAVANALLRKGTIDGAEVERLVKRYSRAA